MKGKFDSDIEYLTKVVSKVGNVKLREKIEKHPRGGYKLMLDFMNSDFDELIDKLAENDFRGVI